MSACELNIAQKTQQKSYDENMPQKGGGHSYLGKLVHVLAHELRRPIDGLDTGAAALLEALLEVCLGRVIKDELGPPL